MSTFNNISYKYLWISFIDCDFLFHWYPLTVILVELHKAVKINEHFNSSHVILCLRFIRLSYDYCSFSFSFLNCQLIVFSHFSFWVVYVCVFALLFVGNLYSLGDENNWNKKESWVIRYTNMTSLLTKKSKIFIKNISNYLKKVLWSSYYILHTVLRCRNCKT